MTLAVDDIISRCQTARAEPTPALAVRDLLEQLTADPGGLDSQAACRARRANPTRCSVVRSSDTPGKISTVRRQANT